MVESNFVFGGITKEKNDEMKHLDNSSNLSLFSLQAFKAKKKVEVNLHKKPDIVQYLQAFKAKKKVEVNESNQSKENDTSAAVVEGAHF